VIERTTKIFALQAREKGVALHTAVPDVLPTIAGDETKLAWAVSNLLSNALRYTPAGGSVEIAASQDDGGIRVAVTDTGPGIPLEQRERIFERFAQAAEGGEIGSAGLGLAIVRDIVQAHGGRIHLESTVGRGSRFLLELPRG
jgi:signal transduction histidine kinase